MSYNLQAGDMVKLMGSQAKLKVLSAPSMSAYFAEQNQSFGWVKCKVIEDPSGEYEIGYTSEFNGDFLRK